MNAPATPSRTHSHRVRVLSLPVSLPIPSHQFPRAFLPIPAYPFPPGRHIEMSPGRDSRKGYAKRTPDCSAPDAPLRKPQTPPTGPAPRRRRRSGEIVRGRFFWSENGRTPARVAFIREDPGGVILEKRGRAMSKKSRKPKGSERKTGRKRLPRIHSLKPPGFDPRRQLAELKAITFHRRVP